MRYRIIGLTVAAVVVGGCDAQPPARSAAPSNNFAEDDGAPVGPEPDVFAEVERFTLVATIVGAGTVEPSAGTYARSEEVALTAVPADGWEFDHWEGEVSGTDPAITVTIVEDVAVVAWFVKVPEPTDEFPTDGDGAGGDDAATIVPGSSFASAPPVNLGSDDRVVTDQTLAQASDVHVYDLGAMVLGDRFIATCAAVSGGQLDPMIALFDADAQRVFWNDDIDLLAGDFDAGINDVIRHDSDHYYLAVTSTDYAETTGAYRLTIEVQRAAGVPQIAGQTVVIDLNGAPAAFVAGQNWGALSAFDAADVDAVFAGQTDALRAAILAVVEADFAPYDMTVLTTDDPAPVGPYTTVFLGGSNDMLFGIADGIDFYNANRQDNVIVFTEAFGGLTTSVQALGQAIGNVVSHEVGHVLGLMHTTDVTELMDTTGDAGTLLVDQQFGAAAVFDFPIGLQNAPLLLEETLGLAARPRLIVEDRLLHCGTCGAKLYKVSDATVGR